jgi:hypothetical protein
MRVTFILPLTLALACTAPLVAQEGEPPAVDGAPVTLPSRCQAAEYRQFDFWLGEWSVTSDGQPAGSNTIVAIQGGCVLEENWRGAGPGGITGTSLNIYDRERGAWHQTWVDAGGNLLQLDGGLVDGSMVLEGERPAPTGKGSVRHRIAWTPNEDGTVSQSWQASQDGGLNWTVIFDGLYTRSGGETE